MGAVVVDVDDGDDVDDSREDNGHLVHAASSEAREICSLNPAKNEKNLILIKNMRFTSKILQILYLYCVAQMSIETVSRYIKGWSLSCRGFLAPYKGSWLLTLPGCR